MTEIYNEDGSGDNQDGKKLETPQLPDSVAALVGPGKKYATLEAALSSIPAAQAHIERIERENAEYRARTESAQSIDEVYALVRQKLEQDKALITQPAQFDVSAVAGIVSTQMQALESAKLENANIETFKTAMAAHFGDKAVEAYKTEAAKQGLNITLLDALVKTSPAAALKLLGVGAAPKTPQTYLGTVNTTALGQRPQLPPEHKPVMFGADTADILAAWRRAAPTE
jgi:hypothetical protein